MKKTLTRTLAALIMAAGFSTMASAQSVTLSTYSKIDFKKVQSNTKTVRMNRAFLAGYNTICLPFSVSANDLKTIVGSDVMLEKLVKVEDEQLIFLDVTDQGIEAGMPYLIYSPTKKTAVFTTSNMELTEAPKTITIGNVSMVGNYEPFVGNGVYGIPAMQDTDLLQAILVRTEGDKTFLPTRCGINYTGAKSPVIQHVTSLDNDMTAISKLQAANTKADIYTVGGNLVKKNTGMNDAMNTLSRGVYVVNGMKFMVK